MDNGIVITALDNALIVRGAVGQLSNEQLIDLMQQVGATFVTLCTVDGSVLGAFSLVTLQEVYC